MLIVLSGLPGVGKTTIARGLARNFGAVHVRVDTIEQALRQSGAVPGEMNDAGYRVAYAFAADNVRLGRTVIADCVNPWTLTRDAWKAVADQAGVRIVEVEIVCSDRAEHRRRVDARDVDIPGLHLPTWEEVHTRDYQTWTREHLTCDTAGQTPEESIAAAVAGIRGMLS